jgi:hypothetical protein
MAQAHGPDPCGTVRRWLLLVEGHRGAPITAPEALGNAGRIKWVSGRPGEAPTCAGTDSIISWDGRIAALYLFFDKLP